MTRWILVRHAQSAANADGYLSGHLDVPLTVIGWQQAVGLGHTLRSVPIGRVVSSDLQRAADTASAALHGRSYAVRTTPALRERHLGDWTGIRFDALRRQGGREALRALHARPPGGESLLDVARRAMVFLDRIDDGRPTLVVSHGGLLRAILSLTDGTAPELAGARHVDNATPMVRDLPPGHWGRLLQELR